MSERLKITHLSKTFYKNTWRRDFANGRIEAVRDVSFSLADGHTLGIVGESGSGKSTLVRMIAGLEKPTGGSIFFRMSGEKIGKNGLCAQGRDGEYWDLSKAGPKEYRKVYRHMQMIFQAPQQSFDPRRTLGDGITEGLCCSGVSRTDAEKQAGEVLEKCGLPSSYLKKYPGEVSGGECQRAAIARALVMRPELLILDEPTSALDVTVQRQILDLLKKIREQNHMTFLFIGHDIAVVKEMSDEILVMQDGRIIEQGKTDEVIRSPRQAYTRELLDGIL